MVAATTWRTGHPATDGIVSDLVAAAARRRCAVVATARWPARTRGRSTTNSPSSWPSLSTTSAPTWPPAPATASAPSPRWSTTSGARRRRAPVVRPRDCSSGPSRRWPVRRCHARGPVPGTWSGRWTPASDRHSTEPTSCSAAAYGPAWKSDLVVGGHAGAVSSWITTPAAIAGWPMMSVPVGLVEGLPVGSGPHRPAGRGVDPAGRRRPGRGGAGAALTPAGMASARPGLNSPCLRPRPSGSPVSAPCRRGCATHGRPRRSPPDRASAPGRRVRRRYFLGDRTTRRRVLEAVRPQRHMQARHGDPELQHAAGHGLDDRADGGPPLRAEGVRPRNLAPGRAPWPHRARSHRRSPATTRPSAGGRRPGRRRPRPAHRSRWPPAPVATWRHRSPEPTIDRPPSADRRTVGRPNGAGAPPGDDDGDGEPTEPVLPTAADEPGTAPGDRRFRPDVEGLRAVAVLLVVLYHADLSGCPVATSASTSSSSSRGS